MLDSAVEFSPDFEWAKDNDIKKMVEEFKLKSQEMGFYDQRMTYNNYHDNIEDELKAAYEETTKLESDMRRLVTLTEVLVEQVDQYENRITDMKHEKDNAHAESDYIQENFEAMLEREHEKDEKICQLELDISEIEFLSFNN